MKIYSLTTALVACLAVTSAALATTLTSNLPHEHLAYTGALIKYDLVNAKDPTEVISVVKKAIPPPAATASLRWEVTIRSNLNKTHTYSLLTLGVQAVTHATKILGAPGGPLGAKFAKVDDATANRTLDPQNGLEIPMTGTTGTPPTVDETNVWLIQFTGTECTLIIEPISDRIWTTKWSEKAGFEESHGVEPPH